MQHSLTYDSYPEWIFQAQILCMHIHSFLCAVITTNRRVNNSVCQLRHTNLQDLFHLFAKLAVNAFLILSAGHHTFVIIFSLLWLEHAHSGFARGLEK